MIELKYIEKRTRDTAAFTEKTYKSLGEHASVIVEDSTNSKTYLCYTGIQDALSTESVWRIVQIDQSVAGITEFKTYKSFEYLYPIDTGGGILATMQAYDAAGDFIYFNV